MIKKLKLAMVSLVMSLGLAAPVLVPSVAYAATGCTNIGNKLAEGVDAAAGTPNQTDCQNTDTSTTGIKRLAANIVNILSIIIGIVAVIMIIFGGFRYITSGGDSGRVGNAKNTLIYAIVGLIIVALAQVIVRFVLSAGTSLT